MKSPEELRQILRRQWDNPALRESRLLGGQQSWPLFLSIGRPSPGLIRSNFDSVKYHIEEWRGVTCGQVVWESVRYRDMASPIDIPRFWKLNKPSEWIDACSEKLISKEFNELGLLVEKADAVFHPLLVRRRSLWREKSISEVVQAACIAMVLQPGIAAGKPLRTMSIQGIDTKFFERNEQLLTAMLDVRFDGEASAIGMEQFLGAYADGDHWLLVVDLDGSLLPFRIQRVRSSELRDVVIPGERLLLVENETSQHQLPCVPKTVAVLGAGFDLNWTSSLASSKKRIAYWGDIDTWGLQFLAKARQTIGDIDALMMTAEVFQQFAHRAVSEPVVASTEIPEGLIQSEKLLYEQLLNAECGRLEQEFLPDELIRECILAWANR